VGAARRPSAAIVAATDAIWVVVASSRPCPMAVDPSASASPISAAGGMLDGGSSGSREGRLKPKRSAISTSRPAPTRTPSGANTELQECAKELRNVPPQASPSAFSSRTPSSTAAVSTGNESLRSTTPCSSAAASVMILNTEPGGCGASAAVPAIASTSPVRGSSATAAP
jgi:hypothetical protein